MVCHGNMCVDTPHKGDNDDDDDNNNNNYYYSTMKSPSREAKMSQASLEIPRIL